MRVVSKVNFHQFGLWFRQPVGYLMVEKDFLCCFPARSFTAGPCSEARGSSFDMCRRGQISYRSILICRSLDYFEFGSGLASALIQFMNWMRLIEEFAAWLGLHAKLGALNMCKSKSPARMDQHQTNQLNPPCLPQGLQAQIFASDFYKFDQWDFLSHLHRL